MKKGIITLIILAIAGLISLKAQQLKLAHINTQELLAELPESDSAQAKIQKANVDWTETLEEMQVEYNQKREDYIQNEGTFTDIKKQAKMAELQDIERRIQMTYETAEKELQALRQKLLTPIIESTTKAIEEVAREEGYTYVFDTSEGSVVIFSAENAVDIMEKVKAKLIKKSE